MKTFEEVMEMVLKGRSLGPDYELREVTRWTVHCKHCGNQIVGDTPTTDKAFAALKRSIEGRECRNLNCVSRGGTERAREILDGDV